MLVALTQREGDPVFVNPAHVMYVRKDNGRTELTKIELSGSTDFLIVRETVEDVRRRLAEGVHA